MGDDVAPARDRTPGNIGHGVTGLGRKGSNGFADDPEVRSTASYAMDPNSSERRYCS